jgi:hypothetical protein
MLVKLNIFLSLSCCNHLHISEIHNTICFEYWAGAAYVHDEFCVCVCSLEEEVIEMNGEREFKMPGCDTL